MTFKQILKEIINNINDIYFKVCIGFTLTSCTNGWFIIPTIELNKCGKYFEINIWILCACLYFTISKQSYKEYES